MWQDYVLTAGSIAFVLALIPAVRAKEKPALSTCAMTATVLYTFAAVDVTLGLYFTAVTTALTAGMWTILLVQSAILRGLMGRYSAGRSHAHGQSANSAEYRLDGYWG